MHMVSRTRSLPLSACQRWIAFGRLLSFALASLLCFAALSASAEDNWPQWRGTLATGAAPSSNPPLQWSENENIKWKVKIPGRGTSTPIVWQNKLFIQSAVPTGKQADSLAAKSDSPPKKEEGKAGGPKGKRGGGMRTVTPTDPYQFVLLCLDRKSGKELWSKVARKELPHEGHHPDHGFSSYSSVTDGEHVFAYFGSRGLYCYDLEGSLKWHKDLGDMKTKNSFGEGSSPALSGDTIVINWDHEGEDFIVALDKRTGDERWRTPRDEDTTWSTPIIVEHEGKKQVITTATGKIRSYDLETGKQIWEHTGLTPNTIPSPVSDDGIVYAMAGFRGNALYAIRLGSTGDLTSTEAVLWTHKRATPYVPSPLLYGDKLYFFSSNNNVISCFDAKTGKALFDSQRVEGLQGVYASPVGAGGKVYLVGRNGTTAVIKHSGEFEVLATNKLEDRIDASPAIAGNELFLRGHQNLYSIAEK